MINIGIEPWGYLRVVITDKVKKGFSACKPKRMTIEGRKSTYINVDYRVVAKFVPPQFAYQLVFPSSGKFPVKSNGTRDERDMGKDPIVHDAPLLSSAAVLDVTKVADIPERPRHPVKAFQEGSSRDETQASPTATSFSTREDALSTPLSENLQGTSPEAGFWDEEVVRSECHRRAQCSPTRSGARTRHTYRIADFQPINKRMKLL